MNRVFRYGLIGVLFLALIAVRFFQETLFYDPLIAFFHGDFKQQPLPELAWTNYLVSLVFRFALNTGISLLILYLAFRKRGHLVFASIVYGIVLVAGTTALVILLNQNDPENHMVLFYARRILIHPLLLLVLLPAFYFQEKMVGKDA